MNSQLRADWAVFLDEDENHEWKESAKTWFSTAITGTATRWSVANLPMSKHYTVLSKPDGTPNQTVVTVSKPVGLALLFWIDDDKVGGEMFSAAANTRKRNILNTSAKSMKIEVYVIGIASLDMIKNKVTEKITKHGGMKNAFVREIGIFSHCGGDGLIT